MNIPRLYTKSIFSIFVLCVFLLTTGEILNPFSSGAPASSTGAPGDATCATTGCHDDAKLNIGNAVNSIVIGDGSGNYTPGQVYTITMSIKDPNSKRFGYQLVALDDNFKNAGTFIIVNEEMTQVIRNFNELKDREYATYTYPGTEPVSEGMGKWEIQWKAPTTPIGKVTFYCGTVSANNDMTDKGDDVYTFKTEIINSTTDVVENEVVNSVTIGPNPAHNFLTVNLNSVNQQITTYKVFSSTGVMISEGNLQYSIENIDIGKFAPGMYLIQFNTTSGTVQTQQFIKQ